jgi:hypothetical protein
MLTTGSLSSNGGGDASMAEQRKVREVMANKTPIRLVAIRERPPEEEEENATPIRSTPEHEAITRRVANSQRVAGHEVTREGRRRARGWRRFIPAGVALAPVVAVLATKVLSKPAPAPGSGPSASVPSLGKAPQGSSVTMPVPPGNAAVQVEATPALIRVQITAEPVEAEVSLDGNVLAGHRLNLEVPRDRGIHVVSVAARGYIPFNQQVSFSDDVVLHISLHRARGQVARRVVRARPSTVESKPQSSGRSLSPPQAPVAEPGMDLDGPARRNTAKPIDERNPYRP